jgi:hypothetical protein
MRTVSMMMIIIIIRLFAQLSRDQTKRSDSTQLNCFVESDRSRDHTKRSDSTQLNCFVESDRSRDHTKRYNSTKLFGRVGSAGVISLTIRLNSTRPVLISFTDSEHFASFVQLS